MVRMVYRVLSTISQNLNSSFFQYITGAILAQENLHIFLY